MIFTVFPTLFLLFVKRELISSSTEKKVILHSFPPVPELYSISPFGIKVESYLRVKEIPYEIVYTSKFGPKGQIPYIHLETEGKESAEKEVEVIPDSNVIITRLEEEFGMQEDFLSSEEKAFGHAIKRMLEEHTCQIGFYYRYVLHIEDFMNALQIPTFLFSADTSRKGAFVTKMFQKAMYKVFTKRTQMRGLLRHTNEELWAFSNDDLRALSTFLGAKKYFFGGNHATAVDCIIFAHLSQFVYAPLSVPFPQLTFMKEECQNLLFFMERFKKRYWQDWEAKCQRQVNQRLIDTNVNSRRVYGGKIKIAIALLVLAFAVQIFAM